MAAEGPNKPGRWLLFESSEAGKGRPVGWREADPKCLHSYLTPVSADWYYMVTTAFGPARITDRAAAAAIDWSVCVAASYPLGTLSYLIMIRLLGLQPAFCVGAVALSPLAYFTWGWTRGATPRHDRPQTSNGASNGQTAGRAVVPLLGR